MQRREEFRKWLSETNRKKNGKPIIESTIDCYVRTIDNISKDMHGATQSRGLALLLLPSPS
jgi:hypothetical protein